MMRSALSTTPPPAVRPVRDVTTVAPGRPGIVNAMTIDVEDYFQVSAFESVVPRGSWGDRESRVCRNTERMLEIFAGADVRATFFVLGWVAERFPRLVAEMRRQGHEVASHGYEHRLVYTQTREEFRQDLRRARAVLEDAAGAPVVGYRAPSYSIVERSMWALDVLIEEGYEFDSSIYPIRHDRYGIPDWPRFMTRVVRPAGSIWELPGSTMTLAGANLPIGGGGYFRLLPYAWTRHGIRLVNAEGQPAIFYLHPWEIDPEQPRIAAGRLSKFRHYRNLDRTEARLTRLLREFSFGPIGGLLTPANSASRMSIPAV